VTRYQVVPLCQFPHKSGHRGGCLTSVRVISNFTLREPSGRVWTRLMSILKPSSIVQVTERLIVYLKVNLKKVIETEKQHFKEELHCKKKIVPEFAQEHWQNATFQLMKVKFCQKLIYLHSFKCQYVSTMPFGSVGKLTHWFYWNSWTSVTISGLA